MLCTRKHLLFNKTYYVYINIDNIAIGETTQNIKYLIPLGLQTYLDWKINDETKKLEGFGIEWKNEWRYFYADQLVCQKVKSSLDTLVIYKNMDNQFKLIQYIGKGQSSQIMRVQRIDGDNTYICKLLKKSKKHSYQQFKNEVSTLKEIKHKNIITLYEIYEHVNHYQLIMEYLKGGSLKQCLKYCRLTLQEINVIIKQLLEAIALIHAKGYIHKDLKPDNILFEDLGVFEKAKIIDFGLSCKIGNILSSNISELGTPGYIAPEFLNNSRINNISEKCDIFSCGAILYYMLTGKLLIKGNNEEELLKNNRDFILKDSLLQKIKQQNYRDIVQKMLNPNPEIRLSAIQLLNILNTIDNQQIQLSTSLQCSQEPVQVLPDFGKLIEKQ